MGEVSGRFQSCRAMSGLLPARLVHAAREALLLKTCPYEQPLTWPSSCTASVRQRSKKTSGVDGGRP